MPPTSLEDRMDMERFLSVNLGNILTILSFLGGGVWFIAAMKNAIFGLSMRLTYVEASNVDQKEEIKKLSQILVTLGRYEERFLRVEGVIEDLRHGRGLIMK